MINEINLRWLLTSFKKAYNSRCVFKKWTFKDVLWVKKTMEWIHQCHQWWSMRYRFFIHFWWLSNVNELLMKLSREIEFIIVCFLENQTSFKATDNGWLPSMISHFYGLRLVHLGMPLFYPKKYSCHVLWHIRFQSFSVFCCNSQLFCHVFHWWKITVVVAGTLKTPHILKVSKAKLLVMTFEALGMRAQIICINLVNPGNTGRPYISIILPSGLIVLKMRLKDVGGCNE